MPTFTYKAKNLAGKTVEETATAMSAEALITQLQSQGYFVLQVDEASSDEPVRNAAPVGKKKFKRKRINFQDTLLFSRQLATLIESGVNLHKSLSVIADQAESENFYKTMADVKASVEQGSSLSVSLARHPRIFNQLWVSLVEVGEAAGTMPLVLNKLAAYLERAAAFRATIISALIYPSILVVIAVGALLFFALVIGPKFKDAYATLDITLPALTSVLLAIFDFLKTNIVLLFGGLCAVIVAGKMYLKTPAGRLQSEKIIFKTPLAGDLARTAIMERFASQMSILVESGVPILHSLDIIQRLIGSVLCERAILDIKSRVREGKLISEEMKKLDFFPPMATQMIAIGEETGELGKMLNHVAEYYQRTLSTVLARFASVFEPIVLVFMGAAIGTMVVAMFLPILNIATGGG